MLGKFLLTKTDYFKVHQRTRLTWLALCVVRVRDSDPQSCVCLLLPSRGRLSLACDSPLPSPHVTLPALLHSPEHTTEEAYAIGGSLEVLTASSVKMSDAIPRFSRDSVLLHGIGVSFCGGGGQVPSTQLWSGVRSIRWQLLQDRPTLSGG